MAFFKVMLIKKDEDKKSCLEDELQQSGINEALIFWKGRHPQDDVFLEVDYRPIIESVLFKE